MRSRSQIVALFLCIAVTLSVLPVSVLAIDTHLLPSEPQVNEFTVTYTGENGLQTVSLLDEHPQQIIMEQSSKPVFTITFDSNSLLDKVYVTSTKDGETKYLEAFPHENNTYITEDYFDPENVDYIPGTISVSYTKRPITVSESGSSDGLDFSLLKQQLENAGISIHGDIAQSGNHSVSAEVVLRDYFDTTGEAFVDASVSELSSSAGIDDDTVKSWLGTYGDLLSFALKDSAGNDYILHFANQDWSDTDSYLMVVQDVSGSKYVKMLLQGTGLNEVAENLSHINTVVKPYLDYAGISKEMDALREEVAAHPTMSGTQKAEAYQKINDLETDQQLFTMGMTFVPLFLGAVAGGPPMMITALLAGYSSVAGYFWEHRIGMIQGCEPVENAFSDTVGHAGWTALTEAYLDQNDLQSGNYYLAEDISSFALIKSTAPIDATICLHGHNIKYGFFLNDNTSLTLLDCKYKENEDGTVTGGAVEYFSGVSNKASLTVNSGNISGELTNYGSVIIHGGTFSAISNDGIMTISGGKFVNKSRNGECIANSGEVNISGGTIINMAEGGRCIWNYPDSTVNISGGSIINTSAHFRDGCIENYGALIINGGSVESSARIIYNNTDATLKIMDGVMQAAEESAQTGIINDGEMIVTGGTVTTANSSTSISNAGILSIKGGTIESKNISGSVISNSGECHLSGGVVRNKCDIGINNDEGSLYITGGTIDGDSSIMNSGNGTVILSSGKIIGPISNFYSPVEFLITDDSNIELINTMGCISSVPLIVDASAGYTGGIEYYSAADSEGIQLTIAETEDLLAQMAADSDYWEFEPYYVRLEAEKADYVLQSEHNISAFSQPVTYIYTCPGASALNVTFSPRTDVSLTVDDQTYDSLAGQTIRVEGDTLTVTIDASYYSSIKFGFAIEQVAPEWDETSPAYGPAFSAVYTASGSEETAILADVKDGKPVQVTLIGSPSEISANLLGAIYDENGKILDIVQVPVDFNSGNYIARLNFNENCHEAAILKLFLINQNSVPEIKNLTIES